MFAVPSGLESSMTRMDVLRFRLSISRMSFSTFADSQYVGRITPISERVFKSPSMLPFVFSVVLKRPVSISNSESVVQDA